MDNTAQQAIQTIMNWKDSELISFCEFNNVFIQENRNNIVARLIKLAKDSEQDTILSLENEIIDLENAVEYLEYKEINLKSEVSKLKKKLNYFLKKLNRG